MSIGKVMVDNFQELICAGTIAGIIFWFCSKCWITTILFATIFIGIIILKEN